MRKLLSFISVQTLLAVATILFAGSPLPAQQVVAGLPGQRVLGERTISADAGTVDVDAIDEHGYVVGADVNFPATANLDLGLHIGHGWIDAGNVGLKDTTISAAAVVHPAAAGLKPFAGVLIGHQKLEFDVGRFGTTEKSGIWGGAVGLEVPAGRATLTPSISYTDSFDGSTDRSTHFTLHANLWLTDKVATYADLTYVDFAGDGDNAWTARLGVRWKF
ncbi:hypothetical protein [Opitutus terrae]|uniref:Outer membrane protein beta-barrel domain-containing protein n=1 Tax=Opitutus terrae (strain DSM 11246 / JCM 15787 / PB90-1) TaxID=452637 RepID=B1ZTJ8_OPITP|nr:hypothetical protein [Opitutus terrae]ACB73943.1 hypothetical protein Oter_0653 [Opitutus terrae PB90-1]